MDTNCENYDILLDLLCHSFIFRWATRRARFRHLTIVSHVSFHSQAGGLGSERAWIPSEHLIRNNGI